ncbi:MAG: hypothetical protein WCT14_15455 [Treponemataceae bacterium]
MKKRLVFLAPLGVCPNESGQGQPEGAIIIVAIVLDSLTESFFNQRRI